MLVTGRPVIAAGMVTAPPEPVYPVIAIAPLLVVNVNWASTAAGSASKTNIASKQVRIRLRLIFMSINECPVDCCEFDAIALTCQFLSRATLAQEISLAAQIVRVIMPVGCRGKPAGKQTPHEPRTFQLRRAPARNPPFGWPSSTRP